MKESVTRDKKPWFSIFMIGFIGGVIFINLWIQWKGESISIASRDTISQLEHLIIDRELLFSYILKTRMKMIGIMILLSTTMIGIGINYLAVGWLGASMGILLSNLAMEFGIKGTLVFLGCIFPHYFIYIPLIISIANWCYRVCAKLYFPHKDYSLMQGTKKQQFIKLLLELCIILFFLIIGILVESYINPIFLHNMLKIL